MRTLFPRISYNATLMWLMTGYHHYMVDVEDARPI